MFNPKTLFEGHIKERPLQREATHLYPMSSNLRVSMWNFWMLRRSCLHPPRPEHFCPAVWWMTAFWAGPFSSSLLFGGTAPHWALEKMFTAKEWKCLFRAVFPLRAGFSTRPSCPTCRLHDVLLNDAGFGRLQQVRSGEVHLPHSLHVFSQLTPPGHH